ncbi:MAG: hypothetical protein PHG04_00145 [Candidatus Nanoarchaeia archaeon]|nr:hypothetical protein [Candidatus Nanoarchaeia archaeon]
MKKLILLSMLALMLSSAYAQYEVDIYFFWSSGCPYCLNQKAFFESIIDSYPQINLKLYDVSSSPQNANLWVQKANEVGVSPRGVPFTVIGDKYWEGYHSSLNPAIISQIENCIAYGGCGEKIINDAEPLCLHAFLTWDCEQCGVANQTFSELKEKYGVEIVIHDYPEQKELYNEFKKTYGIVSAGFPIVFLGDYYLAGDSAIINNLESLIVKCLNDSCSCPVENINAYTSNVPVSDSMVSEEDFILTIPFMGDVDLSSMSLYLVTLIIAIMDGVNPCSLWMIMFLLGIVLYTGSRKKILLIGLTFLITTTVVYGIFMVGLLNILYYVGFVFWIRLFIGLLALLFASVNIKDYFWYKKGLSFTISDEHKPGLFKKIRKLMNPENSLRAMVLGTILLALSVTLVELPCTAGLPVLWTSIMARNSIIGIEFLMHLAIYLGIYMLDEAAIVFAAACTLRMSKFEEKHGRILKLFGGLFMFALGFSMIFMPELMDDFFSMIKIFLAAGIITWAINYAYTNFKIVKKEAEIEIEEKKEVPAKNKKVKKSKKKK